MLIDGATYVDKNVALIMNFLASALSACVRQPFVRALKILLQRIMARLDM
jgi:hypothetical protein